MNSILSTHLLELVETLHDLRRRFRQTARAEVARAIGEALREVTLALICGPVRYPSSRPASYSSWDDPWRESPDDPWESPRTFDSEMDARVEDPPSPPSLPPALVVGLGAARWSFARTGQIGPALVVGLLVALAAHASGPSLKPLLEAWSVSADLLSFPGQERKP